jgi:DNA-binding transcriptional regulator LsrR (DeoR family)
MASPKGKTVDNATDRTLHRLDVIAITILYMSGLGREEIARTLHIDDSRVSELVPLKRLRRPGGIPGTR